MSLDITKLKPGDIIDYKYDLPFPFHEENPVGLRTISLYNKRITIGPNNFLILEIEKVSHHYLKNLHSIKLFTNSKIVWARVTQNDINKFGFYLVK